MNPYPEKLGECPIVILCYDFPHRKTNDFILDLVLGGQKNLIILAAPWRKLQKQKARVNDPDFVLQAPVYETRDLCKIFGLPFYSMEHDDLDKISGIVDKYGVKLALIAGARILKKEVISAFENGVVNIHPGKLPETSGLDSFFYTIKKGVPAGVTTHFIDSRVDAGNRIGFHELRIGPDDSIETVIENLYQLQRIALRDFVSILTSGLFPLDPIERPKKNDPMEEEERKTAAAMFPAWRASQYVNQQTSMLFDACENGDISQLKQILERSLAVLNARNERGWTPLIVASFNQRTAAVQYLLSRGADPNAKGPNGTTPLMYAKTAMLNKPNSSYQLLEILLNGGASANTADRYGKTIIDYVKEAGDRRLEDFLSKHSGI
ncbi:formyltransferase family protein [Piscinibacter sakaiensis]|uniref:formyltransferase family protein n=1 Tax=Piscinibacter sakaiensis TaxID=1547922 RepID=UPI003AABDD98